MLKDQCESHLDSFPTVNAEAMLYDNGSKWWLPNDEKLCQIGSWFAPTSAEAFCKRFVKS